MCRWLWVSLFIWFWSSHSYAQAEAGLLPSASFNCSAAHGNDEMIICGSPILRQQDAALDAAFKAALAANPDRAVALRRDERLWVDARNAACMVKSDTENIYDPNTGAVGPLWVDCFIDQYAMRLARIRNMVRNPQLAVASLGTKIGPLDPIWCCYSPPWARNLSVQIIALPGAPPFREYQLTWLAGNKLLISGVDWRTDTVSIYLWQAGRLATLNVFQPGIGFIDTLVRADGSTYYVRDHFDSTNHDPVYGSVDAQGHFSSALLPGMDPQGDSMESWPNWPEPGHWNLDVNKGTAGPIQTPLGIFYAMNGLMEVTANGPAIVAEGVDHMQLSPDGCLLAGSLYQTFVSTRIARAGQPVMSMPANLVIVDTCHPAAA